MFGDMPSSGNALRVFLIDFRNSTLILFSSVVISSVTSGVRV